MSCGRVPQPLDERWDAQGLGAERLHLARKVPP
jgi:hypothetical protein